MSIPTDEDIILIMGRATDRVADIQRVYEGHVDLHGPTSGLTKGSDLINERLFIVRVIFDIMQVLDSVE